MKEQLKELYRLQQMDSGVDAMKREFAALDPGRAEREVYEQAKTAHTAALQALNALQATQRDTELERKSLELKRAQEEKKLYGNTVRVPKELTALQEEVAMLERHGAKLDEKLLNLMEEIETAKRRETEEKKALRKATSALKEKQEGYKTRADEIAAQGRAFATQRIEQAKTIPPPLLQRYEKMRTLKAGVAIAALEDGNACGGCKLGLPSSIVLLAKEGRDIILCDNCGRILVGKQD